MVVVGPLFLSGPKKGSVEWRKREFERHRTKYLKARDQNTWSDQLKQKYYKVTRTWPPPQTTEEFHERLKGMQKNLEDMRHHREALARLGYFADRTFTVTSADWVMRGLGMHPMFDREDAVIINAIDESPHTPDEITVSAHPNDMPQVETMIRTLEDSLHRDGTRTR